MVMGCTEQWPRFSFPILRRIANEFSRYAMRSTQLGFDVFWDRQIPAGQDWNRTIIAELIRARLVLVFWSPDSATSRNVRHEAAIAIDDGKLIPVVLDLLKNAEFPLGHHSLQAVHLIDWQGDETDPNWRELVAAIEARLMTPWMSRLVDRREAALKSQLESGHAKLGAAQEERTNKRSAGSNPVRNGAIAQTSAAASIKEKRRPRSQFFTLTALGLFLAVALFATGYLVGGLNGPRPSVRAEPVAPPASQPDETQSNKWASFKNRFAQVTGEERWEDRLSPDTLAAVARAVQSSNGKELLSLAESLGQSAKKEDVNAALRLYRAASLIDPTVAFDALTNWLLADLERNPQQLAVVRARACLLQTQPVLAAELRDLAAKYDRASDHQRAARVFLVAVFFGDRGLFREVVGTGSTWSRETRRKIQTWLRDNAGSRGQIDGDISVTPQPYALTSFNKLADVLTVQPCPS